MKIGQIIKDRYEIVEILGEGGMAFVYKAKDRQLRRIVAIKTLKPNYVNQKKFVERFRREAQTAANLNHPNIVQYIDHRVRNGRMELAMAYCHSSHDEDHDKDHDKDLCNHILSKRDADTLIDLEVARQIAYQLLNAVAYLHDDLGIVHRDIKPDNIIYDKDTGSLQLIDFGYARPFTEDTKLRSKVGTPFYIPPEMLRGQRYTCTVDEWSTGVTLFMVLYGFPPFPGETELEINPLILKSVPWPVECKRSSDAYDCIHNQLLCKNPTKRATAAQVLQSAWLRPCRDTAQA